ncbi:LysM peptidoglycan-binding domain-containing protein [Accumulibacter sp.]|jgi:hypothetical protein|uniref:CIS tube protein n=1 Tax=Accumulibacter sp. TaxID=2053492 RepID=UPI001ACF6FD3|nr:LysM peptidoglycan-binding domain-containing protein [Accumulibacter sp.]MBN8447452.1 LysM peptidoglycan-binding domain-containing protein [Candidatus Accumulibacter necessarius]MBN8452069.1 LysM peptidoglycan-binding domain-containing protein [Accumulibacter sp.]
MGLGNLFKLEKLRIEAFKDAERKSPADPPSMEVMFNPASYKRKYEVAFSAPQAIGSAGKPAGYSFSPPGDLAFQFVFDGTGVAYSGVEHAARALRGESVKKQIVRFEKLCLKVNGDSHQPNFLRISWGDHLKFDARLRSLDITYKLFEEGGDPLRAEIDASFVDDRTAETIALDADKKSPDLTHIRMVKSGDTLPLLCKEIYGSSAYYLRVAADNGLDDFRRLIPGQTLRFAPLKSGQRATKT